MGDENYEFEGNSDYSSTKSIKFPWPLLCTRLRVYPRASVGGIEMSMKLRGYTDGKLVPLLDESDFIATFRYPVSLIELKNNDFGPRQCENANVQLRV